MIAYLTGILIEKQPAHIILEVQGVGYEVHISMQTYAALPEIGQSVRLLTQQIIREDAHLLFGFAEKSEKTAFLELLKVSGVGAKTALAVLSVFDSDSLANAIANDDVRKISSVPGIGKKTAERLILELRGKLTHTGVVSAVSNTQDEVIETLIALGYSEKESRNAAKGLPENGDTAEGVRMALKKLSS
ncbi:MAG: Holliday junction branch migration protein RuvA [Neisseriaceae bacterium]|nr:Holliday junction branch migration protein RuvA [Neisseriaceae bacterium]